MKVRELIQEIREDWLDDDREPFLWKEATLLRWLSRAEEEACTRSALIVDEATPDICRIALVPGLSVYDIDPRVVFIKRVTYNGEVLQKRTIDDLDRHRDGWKIQSVRQPIEEYVQNDLKLELIQTPTEADQGKYLKLRVHRLPLVPFTDLDQQPEIAQFNHRDLIWFVLYNAFSRPDEDSQDTNNAMQYLAQFDRVFGPPLRADVIAHRRRNSDTSYIGQGHAYHGRRTKKYSAATRFDYED